VAVTNHMRRLIAEYLTRTAAREPLKWAMVGRDATRISEVSRSVSAATGLPCTSDFFVSTSEDQVCGGSDVLL
jgi:hypothetical protein